MAARITAHMTASRGTLRILCTYGRTGGEAVVPPCWALLNGRRPTDMELRKQETTYSHCIAPQDASVVFDEVALPVPSWLFSRRVRIRRRHWCGGNAATDFSHIKTRSRHTIACTTYAHLSVGDSNVANCTSFDVSARNESTGWNHREL